MSLLTYAGNAQDCSLHPERVQGGQHQASKLIKAYLVMRTHLISYHSEDSTWASLKFLQQRMQLGWGTARVAIGMALASENRVQVQAVEG